MVAGTAPAAFLHLTWLVLEWWLCARAWLLAKGVCSWVRGSYAVSSMPFYFLMCEF